MSTPLHVLKDSYPTLDIQPEIEETVNIHCQRNLQDAYPTNETQRNAVVAFLNDAPDPIIAKKRLDLKMHLTSIPEWREPVLQALEKRLDTSNPAGKDDLSVYEDTSSSMMQAARVYNALLQHLPSYVESPNRTFLYNATGRIYDLQEEDRIPFDKFKSFLQLVANSSKPLGPFLLEIGLHSGTGAQRWVNMDPQKLLDDLETLYDHRHRDDNQTANALSSNADINPLRVLSRSYDFGVELGSKFKKSEEEAINAMCWENLQNDYSTNKDMRNRVVTYLNDAPNLETAQKRLNLKAHLCCTLEWREPVLQALEAEEFGISKDQTVSHDEKPNLADYEATPCGTMHKERIDKEMLTHFPHGYEHSPYKDKFITNMANRVFVDKETITFSTFTDFLRQATKNEYSKDILDFVLEKGLPITDTPSKSPWDPNSALKYCLQESVITPTKDNLRTPLDFIKMGAFTINDIRGSRDFHLIRNSRQQFRVPKTCFDPFTTDPTLKYSETVGEATRESTPIFFSAVLPPLGRTLLPNIVCSRQEPSREDSETSTKVCKQFREFLDRGFVIKSGDKTQVQVTLNPPLAPGEDTRPYTIPIKALEALARLPLRKPGNSGKRAAQPIAEGRLKSNQALNFSNETSITPMDTPNDYTITFAKGTVSEPPSANISRKKGRSAPVNTR